MKKGNSVIAFLLLLRRIKTDNCWLEYFSWCNGVLPLFKSFFRNSKSEDWKTKMTKSFMVNEDAYLLITFSWAKIQNTAQKAIYDSRAAHSENILCTTTFSDYSNSFSTGGVFVYIGLYGRQQSTCGISFPT